MCSSFSSFLPKPAVYFTIQSPLKATIIPLRGTQLENPFITETSPCPLEYQTSRNPVLHIMETTVVRDPVLVSLPNCKTPFTYFWHSRSQSPTWNLDVDNMPTPQPYTANQQNQAGPKPGTYQQAPPPQYYQPQQQPTPYQGQPQTQPQMIYVQPHQPQQSKRKDDGCCSPCALFVSTWCRL